MGAQPAGGAGTRGKGKRETWRNWLVKDTPEPKKLLTRDELVERLAHMGVDASAGDLQFWEGSGVLPRAVRQWYNGAVRAVYPDWYPYLVQEVRRLQAEGYTLRQIPLQVRLHAHILIGIEASMTAAAKALNLSSLPPLPTDPREIPLWPELVTELERLAWLHQAIAGAPSTRVEVVVTDATGRVTPYTLPLTSGTGADSNSE